MNYDSSSGLDCVMGSSSYYLITAGFTLVTAGIYAMESNLSLYVMIGLMFPSCLLLVN